MVSLSQLSLLFSFDDAGPAVLVRGRNSRVNEILKEYAGSGLPCTYIVYPICLLLSLRGLCYCWTGLYTYRYIFFHLGFFVDEGGRGERSTPEMLEDVPFVRPSGPFVVFPRHAAMIKRVVYQMRMYRCRNMREMASPTQRIKEKKKSIARPPGITFKDAKY